MARKRRNPTYHVSKSKIQYGPLWNAGYVVTFPDGKKITYPTKEAARTAISKHKQQSKKTNPSALPRGKWINAKIRVTKSGKIQAKIKR